MKFVFIILTLALISNLTYSQIRINANNQIALGSSTNTPGVTLDIGGGLTNFYSENKSPLRIGTTWTDPRIQSDRQVVFYNLSNTGFIDLQIRTLYEFSDFAAKENIKSLTAEKESPLTKITKLKGVSYSWKNAAVKSKQIGLIAQEVEEIIPDVVATNDSTGAKMLSYSHLIPYLIEAIKEQQVIIENMQVKITTLNSTLGIKSKQEGSDSDTELVNPGLVGQATNSKKD